MEARKKEIDDEEIAKDMMLAIVGDVMGVINRRLKILENIIPLDGYIMTGMLQASIAPAIKMLSHAGWDGEKVAAVISMMAMLEDRNRSGGAALDSDYIVPIEREIADVLRPINQKVKEL